MIRVASITLREIRLPLVEPFRTSHGTVKARRILLLEMIDADGRHAWSECVAQEAAGYSHETVDGCWTLIEELLAPRIAGVSFRDPAQVHAMLEAGAAEARMARGAIEMGTWALASMGENLPLGELLARHSETGRESGSAPRSYVETGIALGIQRSPEAAADRARAAAAEGYRRVKLKIVPASAVAEVKAVRSALQPDVSLGVDANGSFRLDQPAHVATLDELDALGLSMIEQPLPPDDLHGLAQLQARLATAVCLDESITGPLRAREMIELGSGRMVNVKPGRVGGFQQALAIHDLCVRAHVPTWCGGMLESGIGRAYNVALASLPGFTEPGDLSPSARYWKRDVVKPEWTMDAAGRVRVPLEHPGLGVEVDVGFIDDLTARATTVRAG